MAVSDDYVVYLSEQLASLGRVTSRRMFGGVGLYANGLFFAIIAADTVYFKTAASNRADYEARGSRPFAPFADKPTMVMNYHQVPADLIDDADELSRWAKKSLAVALSASSEKARVPKPKSAAKRKKTKTK